MERVTGIGGIFLKANDPEKLCAWYEEHRGLKRDSSQAVVFKWRDFTDSRAVGTTVWALFPKDTPYFASSRSSFMMNFRVDDLDGLLEILRKEGVEVDKCRENYDYGRFAWITDPEGNRIELWEPPQQRE